MEDSVAIRLKLFMDKIGVTNSEFADNCGIPRPTLSQLITGRNKKVSDVLVGQIHKCYPQLSILWLLFGEGEMLKNDDDKIVTPSLWDASVFSSGDESLSENGEIENFPLSGRTNSEYGKENALTSTKNATNASNKSLGNNDLQTKILKNEIEFLKLNPRKVVQITIYYDDSTFETFIPGSLK